MCSLCRLSIVNFSNLKAKGMSTYTIRRDHIIGVAALEKMRKSEGHIDTRTIERICAALHCQPGDIMEYIPGDEEAGHSNE